MEPESFSTPQESTCTRETLLVKCRVRTFERIQCNGHNRNITRAELGLKMDHLEKLSIVDINSGRGCLCKMLENDYFHSRWIRMGVFCHIDLGNTERPLMVDAKFRIYCTSLFNMVIKMNPQPPFPLSHCSPPPNNNIWGLVLPLFHRSPSPYNNNLVLWNSLPSPLSPLPQGFSLLLPLGISLS